MALTQCPDCAGQVSTESKSCPHCGLRVRFDWGKVLIVFVVHVLAVGFGAIAYTTGNWWGALIIGAVGLWDTSVILVALTSW